MDWITRVVWPVLLSLAAAAVAPGCNQIFVVSTPGCHLWPVVERLSGPRWTLSTSALLSEQGLEGLARHHPRDAFYFLEQGAGTERSDPERLLALAELADQIGRTTLLSAPREALLRSRDAAVYATFCLEKLGDGQAGSVMWCTARDVHNDALARCLRLARTSGRAGTA